jgi:hypothetical protein
MKHLKLTTICLGLALVLTAVAATGADAGMFGKKKKEKRTEKAEEEMTPRRFDKFPNMRFMGGTLTQDAHTGWRLGDTPLYLGKDCVISVEGSDSGSLEEGREAVVMGSMVGGMINAWSILVMQPVYKTVGMGDSQELKEPGNDPRVGKILKPAE